MSIGINLYSKTTNAYTAVQKNAEEKNLTLEQMQKRMQNPALILKFDTLESGNIVMLSDEEMQRHIEEGRQIITKHQQFFNPILTVEDTFIQYEKGREEILKTFANDRMLQVHLDVFDNAFTSHLSFLARNAAMVLVNQQSMYQAQVGKNLYEYNKIATHENFDYDEFLKNATHLMSQFALSFTQQIKDGVGYDSAHKNAIEYMTAAFSETTSVNNLSFNDFSLLIKTMTTENDNVGLNPNIWGNFNTGESGEKNDIFNNSADISEELQALLSDESNSEIIDESQSTASNSSNATNDTAPVASQQALGGLLKRVEMMQGDFYTGNSWGKLMKTYGNSKAVFLKEPPDEKDLSRALRALMRDFMALQQAEKDENPHRDKLPIVLGEDTSHEQAVADVVASMSGIDISVDISV